MRADAAHVGGVDARSADVSSMRFAPRALVTRAAADRIVAAVLAPRAAAQLPAKLAVPSVCSFASIWSGGR